MITGPAKRPLHLNVLLPLLQQEDASMAPENCQRRKGLLPLHLAPPHDRAPANARNARGEGEGEGWSEHLAKREPERSRFTHPVLITPGKD